ncbi:hypothetical protein EV684_10297 [Rubrivivax gelatinosus]|uniref:Uncharacterized protein n=1 Tax=Rubrivivax gelatinosus TaxID=28068 RepID=A0A4R2MI57_RUBGE|nr:hypothetical protein EV684_10297 [Rubrivivax gelatinosus]
MAAPAVLSEPVLPGIVPVAPGVTVPVPLASAGGVEVPVVGGVGSGSRRSQAVSAKTEAASSVVSAATRRALVGEFIGGSGGLGAARGRRSVPA